MATIGDVRIALITGRATTTVSWTIIGVKAKAMILAACITCHIFLCFFACLLLNTPIIHCGNLAPTLEINKISSGEVIRLFFHPKGTATRIEVPNPSVVMEALDFYTKNVHHFQDNGLQHPMPEQEPLARLSVLVHSERHPV